MFANANALALFLFVVVFAAAATATPAPGSCDSSSALCTTTPPSLSNTMSNALVIGVTGNVGRGAAKALLKLTGDRAIGKLFAVSRTAESVAALHKSYLGGDERVVPVVADVTTAEGAAEVAALVQKHVLGDTFDEKKEQQVLDHVVVSSGPWWQIKPLHEVDPATYVPQLQ
jgi:NAD(P)-dependent dehydrogenase (short-subunit alcohol dehydrogenase family)